MTKEASLNTNTDELKATEISDDENWDQDFAEADSILNNFVPPKMESIRMSNVESRVGEEIASHCSENSNHIETRYEVTVN